MARWISFDPQTHGSLQQRLSGAEVSASASGEDPLDRVLRGPQAAAAILPGPRGTALLLTRRRAAPASGAAAHDASQPVAYAATGFLGLMDEPIYDDEPPAPKSWWERLWE